VYVIYTHSHTHTCAHTSEWFVVCGSNPFERTTIGCSLSSNRWTTCNTFGGILKINNGTINEDCHEYRTQEAFLQEMLQLSKYKGRSSRVRCSRSLSVTLSHCLCQYSVYWISSRLIFILLFGSFWFESRSTLS